MHGPIMEGVTALLTTVRHFHSQPEAAAEICRLLLNHRPPANANDVWGTDSALWLASRYRGEPLFPMLLEHGADANRPDPKEWNNTLLIRYATQGNAEIVAVLLKHGADREQTNSTGLTALALVQKEHADLVKYGRESYASEIAAFDAVIALLSAPRR